MDYFSILNKKRLKMKQYKYVLFLIITQSSSFSGFVLPIESTLSCFDSVTLKHFHAFSLV